MPVCGMNIQEYRSSEHAEIVQKWLDKEAYKNTGIVNWDEDVRYWRKESPDEFTCLIFGNPKPYAAVYFFVNRKDLHIGELLISPNQRGKGHGTEILRYLIEKYENCEKATAVIFPNNLPSKKAFVKAGFKHTSSHPDGNADYYTFQRNGNRQ